MPHHLPPDQLEALRRIAAGKQTTPPSSLGVPKESAQATTSLALPPPVAQGALGMGRIDISRPELFPGAGTKFQSWPPQSPYYPGDAGEVLGPPIEEEIDPRLVPLTKATSTPNIIKGGGSGRDHIGEFLWPAITAITGFEEGAFTAAQALGNQWRDFLPDFIGDNEPLVVGRPGFNEASATLLSQFHNGKIGLWEALTKLSVENEDRPFLEQVLVGMIVDPTTLIGGGKFIIIGGRLFTRPKTLIPTLNLIPLSRPQGLRHFLTGTRRSLPWDLPPRPTTLTPETLHLGSRNLGPVPKSIPDSQVGLAAREARGAGQGRKNWPIIPETPAQLVNLAPIEQAVRESRISRRGLRQALHPDEATPEFFNVAPIEKAVRQSWISRRGPVDVRVFTPPAQVRAVVKKPKVLRDLESAYLQDQRMRLNAEQRETLKVFIKRNGRDPREAPEALGSVEYSHTFNEHHFILGAYDDPIWGDIVHITFDPKTETFSSQLGQAEAVKASSVPIYTGQEIEKFERVWKSFYGERTPEMPFEKPYQRHNPDIFLDIDSPATAVHPKTSSIQDNFIEEIRKGPETQTLEESQIKAIERTAVEGGGPPPKTRPPGSTESVPGDQTGSLDKFMTTRPGEEVSRAALRQWEGDMRARAQDIKSSWESINNQLHAAGYGTWVRIGKDKFLKMNEAEGLPILRALHDPSIPVPPRAQPVIEKLRAILAQEQSDMLAFDPTFADVILSHPNYFPRLWVDTAKGTIARGSGSKTPWFLKQRRDATFDELIADGGVPVSWNPSDVMALRIMEGVKYRDTMIVLQRMKKATAAVEEGTALANKDIYKNWRSPDVGSVFQGKAYIDNQNNILRQGVMYTDPMTATRLESIFGREPVWAPIGGRNVLKDLNSISQALKVSKLFLTPFQHVDFWTRVTVDAFGTLNPKMIGKLPGYYLRVFAHPFSATAKKTLKDRILDDTPLYKDFPVTNRMLVEEGAVIGEDATLVRRAAMDIFETLEKALLDEPVGLLGRSTEIPRARLRNLREFWESSLFDVTYVESQLFALENVIIPLLRRKYPKWTPRQIAAQAADEVNVLYSTLANWQTAFQGKGLKYISRQAIFSTNESESWIRAMFRTVKGPSKGLYIRRWIGLFIFGAAFGNLINMYSTRNEEGALIPGWIGRPMDAIAYLPVTMDQPNTWLPGGFGYNSRFMAPQLPWRGRNGQPIYLDIMGQFDTPLRWILESTAAVARLNIIPGEIIRQIKGEGFYGEEYGSGLDRLKHAGVALGMPIGLGNVLQAAGVHIVPEVEGRIGGTGQLFQGLTGINVRGETTPDALDTLTVNAKIPFPAGSNREGEFITKWIDLGPVERRRLLAENPTLREELETRAIESKDRGNPYGALKIEYNEQRIRNEETLEKRFKDLRTHPHSGFHFRDALYNIIGEYHTNMSATHNAFEMYLLEDRVPKDPLEAALVQFYDANEQARGEDGRGLYDPQVAEDLLEVLYEDWTPEQKAYVKSQTGADKMDHTPFIQEFFADDVMMKKYRNIPKAVLSPSMYVIYRAQGALESPLPKDLRDANRLVGDARMAARCGVQGLEARLKKWRFVRGTPNC